MKSLILSPAEVRVEQDGEVWYEVVKVKKEEAEREQTDKTRVCV